jgi:hypothetical protein
MRKNKKIIIKFVLIIFLAVPLISNAQMGSNMNGNNKSVTIKNTNDYTVTKKEKRIGTSNRNNLSAHLGFFDPWVGIYYERLISPYWGFDASIGLIGGSIGAKVYYPKLSNGKVSLYTGLSEGVLLLIGYKHYIPIGLTYLGKKGFRMSFDIGPQIYYDKNEETYMGFTLKLGKSF